MSNPPEKSCLLCDAPDRADQNMVQCDECGFWAHFRCAEVGEDIKDKPWSCSKCTNRLQVPDGKVKKKSKRSGSRSDTGSVRSSVSALVSAIEELVKEQSAREKALDEERAVREKRLEMERVLTEKKMKQEREIREMELQQERELQEMQLMQERTILERKLAAEEEFLKRQQALREQYRVAKCSSKQQVNALTEDDGAIGGIPEDKLVFNRGNEQRKSHVVMSSGGNKVEQWLKESAHVQDYRGAFPKVSAVQQNKKLGKKRLSKLERMKALLEEDSNEETESETEEEESIEAADEERTLGDNQFSKQQNRISEREHGQQTGVPWNRMPDGPGFQDSPADRMINERNRRAEISGRAPAYQMDSRYGRRISEPNQYCTSGQQQRVRPVDHGEVEQWQRLTPEQMAARQFMAKQLPIFRGEPEVWPLFISSFENTTNACGFSNLDNLKRLQDCLQGEALEAVRSRLVLPEAVPGIINDLRNLFGKPEKLLKTLLTKVRRAPAPKADRLETFIHFGIIVKQLCDHLEAAGLTDHLNNPMLVQELVEKLPPHYKLDWVRFKRYSRGSPLRMFTDFIDDVVSDVSEVADFSMMAPHEQVHQKNRNEKRREYVHVHNAPSRVESSVVSKVSKPCWVCKRSDHKVRFCDDFKKLPATERFKLVEKLKLCMLCLNSHGKSRCNFKLRCNVNDCQEYHHPLLHRTKEVVQVIENCSAQSHVNRSVIFRMVPVTLSVGDLSINTLAFLDEGSSVTLIEDIVTNQLQVRGVPEPLTVTWTGNMKRYEDESRRVNVMLAARGSDEKFLLQGAHTVSGLVLPKQDVCLQEIKRRFSHLKDLPVAELGYEEPKTMLGLDNLHIFAPLESRVGQPGEPIGVKTKLGWTVYGPLRQKRSTVVQVHFHAINQVSNQELHDVIRTQYAIEEAGVSPSNVLESSENRRAQEILRTTTIRIGDQFETGLLWRTDERRFPDSYGMAKRRLLALERKLAKNPQMQEAVRLQIEDYQMKQYAHIATEDELGVPNPSEVWYLPLNVVQHPHKPDKLRLVWDAAATVQGISLNTELLKGPDMLSSLSSVLSCFRERRVGFGGDIKEMYHQLKIRKEDRQAQRFLYRSNPDDPEPRIYVMDVATFGSTCSPCSAQFIKNLNAEEYANQFPNAASAITKRHYVDDYYDSVDSVSEAVKLASEVKLVHSKGGFHIRNWVSNSSTFLEQMGEESFTSTVHLKDKTAGADRVLGIIWDTQSDCFLFATPSCTNEEHPTKRGILSRIMSMFDPIGLLSPFTVLGKMLVQDLWRTGCDWDTPIDEESLRKWNDWSQQMTKIHELRIPRAYFGDATSDQLCNVQLHVFTDASEAAYGSVAYFRAVVDGEVRCALVMSRTKVAPLKQLTIPRLELQAAVMGARLAKTVCDNHRIVPGQVFFWCDSRTVLSWIRSDQRRYKPYVGFRIGEILDLTRLTDWRWVPTKHNVADKLTKRCREWSFDKGSAWLNGPSFLYRDEAEWPRQPMLPANIEEEVRAVHLFHDVTVLQPLVDVRRISKWNVLVRTIACVYRFVTNCRNVKNGLPIESLKPTPRQERLLRHRGSPAAVRVPLKQEEYRKAECLLVKMAQAEAYADEVKVLLKNQQRPVDQWYPLERSSPLYKLTPLIDSDGLIRMEGRAKDAELLPFDLRFPVILPKEHEVTKRIIQHYHERFGHAFRETVKNELRQRYYVENLNAAVKKSSSACMWCRVNRNRPSIPRMAPLPVERLSPYQHPFSFVGVDYFGPVDVVVGRGHQKRWIVLFTCLVIRAVHLEVAHDLSAASCLMAIRRFVCRRGPPLEFISDNGTNLKAASKEIQVKIRAIEEECADAVTDARTKWRFIPPATPHMGGSWERLVRTVKGALMSLDDGRSLTDEVLKTTIVEAEDLVNSRPLTYVSEESTESLSPNHFLKGVSSIEPFLVPPVPQSGEALRNAYHRSQKLAEELWKRWIAEYVPTINKRGKWFNETRQLKTGDVVYVVDGNNRKLWVRGIVEEPIVSKDGRIRQAWVRTNSGVYRRSTAKLAVLEIEGGNAGPDAETGPGLRAGDLLETTPLATLSCSNVTDEV